MNNKGFMMAEVVVVSSIVLVTLVALYASYNKIIAAYNQRVDYYDVTTLYKLANFRDTSLSNISPSSTNPVKDENHEIIYYVEKNIIKDNNLSVSNQTFKDYLEYLSTSLDFDNLEIRGRQVDYILVMERCIDEDEDNCKYAYLEVLVNEEDEQEAS